MWRFADDRLSAEQPSLRSVSGGFMFAFSRCCVMTPTLKLPRWRASGAPLFLSFSALARFPVPVFPAMHLSLVCMEGTCAVQGRKHTVVTPPCGQAAVRLEVSSILGAIWKASWIMYIFWVIRGRIIHLSFHISMSPGLSNLKYVPLNPRLGASEAHRSAEPA